MILEGKDLKKNKCETPIEDIKKLVDDFSILRRKVSC